MRLGGFFSNRFEDPAQWVSILREKGYRAAYSPFSIAPGDPMPPKEAVKAYRRAAADADIVIAEVGAWGRNTLAEDEKERQAAILESQQLLDLADRLGARCLVNLAGKRQSPADNFSPDTFALIVDTVREIIDAVRPRETAMTLELVPSLFPNSVESYLDLLKAVDRTAFAVHLDPVNLIDNPCKYYRNAEFLKTCFKRLGPYLRSCHAKDVILRPGSIVHIDEVRPGLGQLDYQAFIRLADQLDPDLPLMLEHLESDREYELAADYVSAMMPSSQKRG